jgi:hypothetical protein
LNAEQDLRPPVVRSATTAPPENAGLAKDVMLGPLRCADEVTGMSSVEIAVTNSHPTQAAWYEVTLQFLTADGRVFATETASLQKAAAGGQASIEVTVARPLAGNGISARITKVERQLADPPADETPRPTSLSALEAAMKVFIQERKVPARTPYGVCPANAPQAWWIGTSGNCWVGPAARPTIPRSTPAPAYPGTVCADGRVTGSTVRGTCSHHGGIAP